MNEKIKLLDKKPGKGGHHAGINGGISEAIFILLATKNNWHIAIPIGAAKSWDFIVKIDDAWKTIQVKTIYIDKAGDGKRIRCINVRKGYGKNYIQGDFDFIFAASDSDCWLIPWEDMKDNTSCISLDSKKWLQYKIT